MKKTAISILVFLILISCHSESESKFNLGFEKQSNDYALSDGWFQWGDYTLSIDTLSNSGGKSGKITSTDNGQFGSIAYKIPANYSGKTIELEGYMKIKNVENGFAGLLLRVDGKDQSLVFDNMHNRNISGTIDWQKYSIILDYPEGAENIYIGGLLNGKGEAWFDDFVLSIDGKNIQTLEGTGKPVFRALLDNEFDKGSNVYFKALTSDNIENLALLGKIWGFLKYHHPEIAKGNFNWDYELFRIIPTYLKETNESKREELLLHWIDDLGKVSVCKTCTSTPPDAIIKPDIKWIDSSIKNESLRDKLNYIYENRNQDKNFYVVLATGIGNPIFTNEHTYSDMPFPDSGFRVLSLFRYWNMINYFFPYKHLIDKDWNNILNDYIPVFVNAKNELEYEMATIQLIGEIHDTHANLIQGNNKTEEWKGAYYSPAHVRFIEDKLVVFEYYNPELKEAFGLEIGDIITKIDGKNINNIVSDLTKYYPASNETTQLSNMANDLLRSQKNELEIEYVRNERLNKSMVKLFPLDSLKINEWFRRDDADKCYRLLDNNIGYITLKTIKDQDIPSIKREFKNTKGIIIDIRNYPSSTFVPLNLGSYFVSSPTPFVKFTIGNIKNPGEFTFTQPLEILPSKETYQGKLIVLVNELSVSRAEYTAMAFRAGDNTIVIGSTTAGADGNVSTIMLPGGLRTGISGIGVYYPNGDETQRVGIVPDVEVKPTIDGIKNGKDELIDKAIEIILRE